MHCAVRLICFEINPPAEVRLCAFETVPQRAPTAGKHQECGQNGQKGAACRHHNELFVSKKFKAMETVEEVTKQVKLSKSTRKPKKSSTKERRQDQHREMLAYGRLTVF
ncbi:uncharacterized protein LOC144199968 isoform X1 [Stigmatopora nigra]